MKAFKRMMALAAILCLLASFLPSAFAVDEERFAGKTWEQVTNEFLNSYGAYEQGMIGIGYYNTVTGEEQYINPDEYITVGSVYKVPLNMLYAERISQGEMTLQTTIFGIPYETLMRGTIIDSNNDYAKTLWDNIGSYHLYRQKIAPYMGEDPETVNWKFYENNFFTARQMITCLRTLYENPDRFPYIIDTMKEAEPNNYFHRDETRYEIAHKYGFNNEGYHSYVADSGILYTTDPFLLVVFTDNTPQAYDVLARYAVLMCEYTEYHTAERMKSGAADRAVETVLFPEAPEAVAGSVSKTGGETPVLDMDLETFGRLVGVLALTVFGLGLCVKLARHAGYVTIVPALIILVAGLLISRGLIRSSGATLFSLSRGNGSEAVETFFTDLEEGEYAAACELLNGYTALGLEKTPEDADAARIYNALRASYEHHDNGGTTEDNTAVRSVTLRHLSISAVEDAVRAEMKSLLAGFSAERPTEEVYDENYDFLPELVEEAYAQAFETVMGQSDLYCREDTMDLEMQFGLKGWSIQPNEALMNAICGK